MKDEMNFDNLEEFLQSEVNNQKMFPSDRVWNNIAKEIQPTKSWPALTAISLFIVLSLGIATIMNYPPKINLQSIIYISSQHLNINQTSNTTNRKLVISSPNNLVVAGVIPTNNLIPNPKKTVINVSTHQYFKSKESHWQSSFVYTPNTSIQEALVSENNKTVINSYVGEKNITELKSLPTVHVISPKIIKESFTTVVSHSANQFRPLNKVKQHHIIQYEIYTTPSSSYRTLQNDQVLSQIDATYSSNVNNKVKQKAGLGFELGLGVRYNLTNNLTFKTGLQFNIRQYTIDAYQTSNGLASIQVVQNNKVETLGINSSFSNSNTGAVVTRLNNKLYQVSIPIGVDWTVYSKKRIGLNIGASLQPTYSINRNVYILSTDYKYYANGESLFRKWNINSCVNAGITYKTKSTTFSFGPQIRYQHLSTFVDKYPIKEYRLDYGIRLGIIKTLK